VCCETIKCTQCPYCNFSACVTCTSTFLLGLSKDSHCMNCNKLWTREVLITLLPKSFINGKYKWHRENILFEREKSLFPVTQPIVVWEKRMEEVRKIRELTGKELRSEGIRTRYNPRMVEIREVENKIHNLRYPMARTLLYEAPAMARTLLYEAPVKKKKKFIRKCPVNECQGFLSTSWKCSLCTNSICKECNEIDDEDHKCDPATVETIKLLAKDTKPCPKCGEMIFKASGCSQMWCTSCHCVFDWNTMEVDNGIVHNPHYYEYQRQHGTLARQPGDVPCGGDDRLPDFYDFTDMFGYNDDTLYIGNVHRLCTEVIHYRQGVDPNPNLENRKKFMRGQLSEYKFKSRIQQTEKHREKKRDMKNIIDMFGNVLKDLLIQLLNRGIQVEEMRLMVENLVVYTNESLRKVKVLYDNCVMEFVDPIRMVMESDSKKVAV
jgi:hypothetical protein